MNGEGKSFEVIERKVKIRMRHIMFQDVLSSIFHDPEKIAISFQYDVMHIGLFKNVIQKSFVYFKNRFLNLHI